MSMLEIGAIIFIFFTIYFSLVNWRLYTAMPDQELDEMMVQLDIGYESKPEMVDRLYILFVVTPSLFISVAYSLILGGAA